MQPLIAAEQARAADEAAVAAGDTWDGLMGRAGHGLARVVLDELRGCAGGAYGRDVVLLAGKGDNGGDAWVAARHLADAGVRATVVAVDGLDVDTSAHGARARAAWRRSGGRVREGVGADVADLATGADLLVDALLGTGVRGAPRGPAGDAVRLCNATSAPVVSADLPSGLDGDTGRVAGDDPHDDGAVVRAVRTATFGARKRGLALHPGRAVAGRVDVVGLGPRWSAPATHWWAVDDGDVTVAPHPPGTDKRDRGRVLVVAGSQRFAGAGALSAAAAVRGGAGLVTLATAGPDEAVRALEPGVMVVPLPVDATDAAGGPAADATERVGALLADVDLVVLGPGCGHGAGTRALAEQALAADLPVVLDADGVNVFRGDADGLRQRRGPLVLTPHHRELGRLVDPGLDPADVLARRGELAPTLAEALDGAVVVAKGPGTVVTDGTTVLVATSGGPALGSGGSGDVLAGLLGAWCVGRPGGGGDVGTVARGVQLHGLLGDRAGAASAGRATASDLLRAAPDAFVALAGGTS